MKMRALPLVISVFVLGSCWLAAENAGAELIPIHGDRLRFHDTNTDLDWLDLSYTAGLSHDEVLAEIQPGGMFAGWQFAITTQMNLLYSDAGITTGIGGGPAQKIRDLQALWGGTVPYTYAWLGDYAGSGDNGPLYWQVQMYADPQSDLNPDARTNCCFVGSYTSPFVASALVRSHYDDVPEPGAELSEFSACVALLLRIRRSRSR